MALLQNHVLTTKLKETRQNPASQLPIRSQRSVPSEHSGLSSWIEGKKSFDLESFQSSNRALSSCAVWWPLDGLALFRFCFLKNKLRSIEVTSCGALLLFLFSINKLRPSLLAFGFCLWKTSWEVTSSCAIFCLQPYGSGLVVWM